MRAKKIEISLKNGIKTIGNRINGQGFRKPDNLWAV